VCDSECYFSWIPAAQALGLDIYVLLWLRYSAFLVLYPVGVGSELTMAALALSQVSSMVRGLQLPVMWVHAPLMMIRHAAMCFGTGTVPVRRSSGGSC
jgi:Protein tyrosine phosphatase-like protein, PTPLA